MYLNIIVVLLFSEKRYLAGFFLLLLLLFFLLFNTPQPLILYLKQNKRYTTPFPSSNSYL